MTKLPCDHIPALYIRSVVAHKLSADYAVGTAPENLVSVTHHHKLFTINRYSACSSDNIFLCALTLHHIGNSFSMIAFKLFQGRTFIFSEKSHFTLLYQLSAILLSFPAQSCLAEAITSSDSPTDCKKADSSPSRSTLKPSPR